ncbi:MAG: isochorismate synthase MenF [Halolamina sp.]
MKPRRATDRPSLVSRAVRIDSPPFRAVVEALDRPRTVWGAPEEATVVAGGAAATVAADGPDRLDAVREAANGLFSSGDVHAGTEAACPRLFGGLAFHEDGSDDGPWEPFPEARFVFPRVQVTYTEDRGTWLTVNAVDPDATPASVEDRLAAERDRLTGLDDRPPAAPPGIVDRRRTTDREDWRGSVAAAVDRIRDDDLRKVVLAQALAADLADDPAVGDVLARLRDTYPDCHLFLVEPDETASFLGATPERLVTRRGRTVETGALAGTTGRGETPAEDEWLARELRNSEKNVHEHELVTEAIRDQLRPFAASVSTGQRTVRRLATVQHLWTPITAELAADEHVLDLVAALHPTPAVGGLPPDAALRTIRETEAFDRGWYAAPVGWFDAAGNGSFAVALRSAVVEPERATMFAGVGIVADSDPDAEWDEVELKFRPMLDELER